MITSTNNKQIKEILQLKAKAKYRNQLGVFVVEGIKMFEEAKHYGIESAFITEELYQKKIRENKRYFSESGIEVELVSEQIFQHISDTVTPQGVLAIVKQKKQDNNVLFYEKKEGRILVLQDIRDPGNMGTIIRSSEGAGITGLIISQGSVDIYNPKVIRATMGSIFRVPFVYAENLSHALDELKKYGYVIYGTHINGEQYYDEIVYEKKIGVLIGNEANGLEEEIIKKADHLVKIPMEGKVESLNAGVAASVIMYETYRQSRQCGKRTIC